MGCLKTTKIEASSLRRPSKYFLKPVNYWFFGLQNFCATSCKFSNQTFNPVIMRTAQNDDISALIEHLVNSLRDFLSLHLIVFNHHRPVTAVWFNYFNALSVSIFKPLVSLAGQSRRCCANRNRGKFGKFGGWFYHM